MRGRGVGADSPHGPSLKAARYAARQASRWGKKKPAARGRRDEVTRCPTVERECYTSREVWRITYEPKPKRPPARCQAGAFRGLNCSSRPWPGAVRSRRARRRVPRCLVREARLTAGTIPQKQNDRKISCGRLQFPEASRLGCYAAGCIIRRACIVANLPPGATMPQEAHGAVGGHGCRRREPDPTLRHRKVRSPTIAAAGSPPAKW
jgi:hypothetical protein